MRNLIIAGLATFFALPGCAVTPAPEVLEQETIETVSKEEEVELGSRLTQTERRVLKFFMDRGIDDRMALSVILGNIKQESMFKTNICEGGARVNYEHCHRGGFGLIQWTTPYRYDGLGRHARVYGMNPSELDTQLSYLVTETPWKKAEVRFKTPGKSMSYYMDAAHIWLGWGVHGARTNYSHYYYANLGELP